MQTEDPTIYRGRRGFHALFHSHPDLTHAWSEDGITWDWSNDVIGPIPQAGGDNERPRVAVDGNGDLSALFVGQLVVANHDGSRTAAFVPNPRGERKERKERKERESTQSEKVEGGQASEGQASNALTAPTTRLDVPSAAYTCPTYADVAQPSMASFKLPDFAGEWYVLATNEPTLPSFCGCTTLNVSMLGVDKHDASKQWYSYAATTRCPPLNTPITATMKGWSNASSGEAGLLHENMALFNKTIPGLVPNMLLELENGTAASYACIGTPLDLFGFGLLARSPKGYTEELIRGRVADLAQRTGKGVLDVDKLRIADAAAFAKCGLGGDN